MPAELVTKKSIQSIKKKKKEKVSLKMYVNHLYVNTGFAHLELCSLEQSLLNFLNNDFYGQKKWHSLK